MICAVIAATVGLTLQNQVTLTPKQQQHLRYRVAEAAEKETGLKLDPKWCLMKQVWQDGGKVGMELDCIQIIPVRARRLKGPFFKQPWDSQLMGKGTLLYRAFLIGNDPEKGEIKPAGKKLTMEDKECGQTWVFNFNKECWERFDKKTGELKESIGLGKEYPAHVHLDKVPIYDLRNSPLYVGPDGILSQYKSTWVYKRYLQSPEDVEKIREGWLSGELVILQGEVKEPEPPQGG